MVQIMLFAGKVAFLLVLYAFVLLVVRSAVKDLKVQQQAQAPQGSSVSAAAVPRAGGPPAKGAKPHAPARGWALVVEAGPGLVRGQAYEVPLGAFVVIGRAPDAHVQLQDTFVSSHHARVEAETGGLVVEDLGSTNGTSVDGEEMAAGQRLLLGPADRLTIGDTVFVVEER
jgi:pSer/pThr/pTyr-binding forkhead associated (FHA) protein